MTIRVLMLPRPKADEPSGIGRVVEAYYRHLLEFDVELVPEKATTYDLKAVHAGATAEDVDVCHAHGLYWTADYDAPEWEYASNAKVISAIRHAREVTVPSTWVAEAFQRDMHFSPRVVNHGIEWTEWQHKAECGGYVLWNKNRAGDVCDPTSVWELAKRRPNQKFVTTFLQGDLPNVLKTGTLPHGEMKRVVQSAAVYLATTKETGGVGVLEAMASGIPVLGYAQGGVLDFVEHGVNGFLAEPGDVESLVEGLDYCFTNRAVLGANARESAKRFTWEAACKQVADVYCLALAKVVIKRPMWIDPAIYMQNSELDRGQ